MSIQLLAPAGSQEAMVAAVRAGADAVYLGLNDFNARRNAQNFDEDALKDAVNYCRARNVRVYLTLNTLVSDQERTGALFTAKKAAEIGVDGLILQDLGLVSLLKRAVTGVELHASTQMSVHSPAALEALHALGITRVVAARELDRKALAGLCKEAAKYGISVEVFVHGALCMSVSGQCYLSAMLGGRSGNRGLCAGPCRLPFGAPNGTGYDLSLKDLSLIDYIGQLEEMGVSSLKIEGRMKRPEYVAAATRAFRIAIDEGKVPQELKDLLKDVFSRSGFTDGYYTGRLGRPMFGVRSDEDKINSAKTLSEIHGFYRSERQSVPVKGHIFIQQSEPVRFTLTDGENSVSLEGDVPVKAKNRPLDKDVVEKQLSRMGGTPFFLNSLEIDMQEGLMLPLSQLNSLRREAAQALEVKRSNVPKREFIMPELAQSAKPGGQKPWIFARFYRVEQIPENLEGVAAVSVPLESDFESINLPDKKLFIDIPRGILSEDYIVSRLERAYNKGYRAALCGNLSAAVLARRLGFEICFDFGMNIFNSDSVKAAKELGASSVVVSPELDLKSIKRLSDLLPKGILAYGRMPLMLTRNCPGKNGAGCGGGCYVTDRKGIKFPLFCRAGFSELLNSKPVWLADKMDELLGLDFIMLMFTNEDKAQCAQVIRQYQAGGVADDFTRGLYFRGVK
ncbi:MAG TPA: U32 family peptidase [Clostridiales bacterium]|nr:U32 family peptidase [Clostridiales bacterium]